MSFQKLQFLNARIINGTGNPGTVSNVSILQDTIAEIGSAQQNNTAEFIDCTGLVLCPGFIDIHTHSDGKILACPDAESRVYQGITTEVGGNCGMSSAPLFGTRNETRKQQWLEEEGIHCDWSNLNEYLDRLEETGIAVNHAMLLGHGSLRKNVAGEENRPLDAGEMKQMIAAVEEGMEHGAFGLSTGLEYAPGRWTPPEEIHELARVVHRHGGLYATHMRNEQEGLLESIEEAIEVGKQTGIPVQISHLKACGRNSWDLQQPAVEAIEHARNQGLDVMTDVYPYTAYSTELAILLASWVREGGTDAAVNRLRDPKSRSKIRKELKARIERSPGDFESIVISRAHTDCNRFAVGLHIGEITERWSVEPEEAIARLLDEERCGVSFVGHGMKEDNVELAIAQPWSMVGSDGFCISPHGRHAESCPHPRCYGTFPRVLRYYANKRKAFSLETAIHKMTAMPAARIGLRDRGIIARGMKADIVVFDPERIEDNATFTAPHRYPSGIVHVLVNGEFVIRDGKHTGMRPGRALRKTR